jgi:hypothetical protein
LNVYFNGVPMQGLEHQDLADRFLAYCGRERFRDFVIQLPRECHHKGRFLFWQEELWAAFARTQPDAVPLAIEGVSEARRRGPGWTHRKRAASGATSVRRSCDSPAD